MLESFYFYVIPVIFLVIGIILIKKNKISPERKVSFLRLLGLLLVIVSLFLIIVIAYVLHVLKRDGLGF